MGTAAASFYSSDSEAPSKPRRHGCAGPQNPFVPFDARDIDRSLTARFEAQAATHPETLAVADDVHRWSYGELNGLANRIGREILSAAQSKDVPIALLFGHGAPAIAAILGVLKAGHAYVPLNTQQPAARLARILQDCDATTIVTDDRNAALAAEIGNPSSRIISLDQLSNERQAGNLGIVSAPEDWATIIFTSGSTGVPKGVAHNHRNILHNVNNVTNCLHLSASDRLIQLFSYDTGAGIPQIYASLLNGASVHLFDIRARGFADLADWMAHEKITIFHSVPQAFRHLVAALSGDTDFPELRLIRLGGEAPSRSDVDLYRQHFSNTALLQISLASTEIAPIRGLFIDRETQLDGTLVPAGYEMPDTEVLILDDDGREVAAGEPGQIAIRSQFLFCGYWRNPDLTAEVMTDEADGRWTFRTGDRGMLLDDGCLIHLGRRKSIVKIGGMSVEVAEVEAALMRDGGVREVAVVGRPDRSGEMRLVAYMVGDATTRDLRTRLARSLPTWMVPAAFVRMTSLPVNRNGKIDRAALPDPTPVRYGEDPPRDPMEASLVAIWEELLQLRPLGICDDFFQIGGDSLLALELVTRIEDLVDRHVPVSLLAENPTVEQQGEILREATGLAVHWPSAVPLQLHGERPPIFFVPGAGHDVTSLISLARGIGIEQPFYGLQPPGQDGLRRPLASVEALAKHFLEAIRHTYPHGPYFLGGGSYGGLIAYEMAQQLTHAGERVAFLGLLDTYVARYPRMRWNAPIRFRIYRRFGLALPQPPERRTAEMTWQMINFWRARFFIKLRRLRGHPLTREAGYFHFVDSALRARRSYRLSSFPGRITLFRYQEQPSSAHYHPDPMLGWRGAAQDFEVVDLPGAHGNASAEAFQQLCDRMRERLWLAQDGYFDTNPASA